MNHCLPERAVRASLAVGDKPYEAFILRETMKKKRWVKNCSLHLLRLAHSTFEISPSNFRELGNELVLPLARWFTSVAIDDIVSDMAVTHVRRRTHKFVSQENNIGQSLTRRPHVAHTTCETYISTRLSCFPRSSVLFALSVCLSSFPTLPVRMVYNKVQAVGVTFRSVRVDVFWTVWLSSPWSSMCTLFPSVACNGNEMRAAEFPLWNKVGPLENLATHRRGVHWIRGMSTCAQKIFPRRRLFPRGGLDKNIWLADELPKYMTSYF